jgi:fructose-1,6-bisphosphatase/inositol monophosphatase family enzyme
MEPTNDCRYFAKFIRYILFGCIHNPSAASYVLVNDVMNVHRTLDRLRSFQRDVRDRVIRSHLSRESLHGVSRSSSADTIYAIDAQVEPLLEAFCEKWAADEGPLVLVAEGLEDGKGNEVESRVFPAGASDSDAAIRVIVDPIDGTRGIMYDKRSAWALAGVAPNRGSGTRLRDIEVAVMTELPTAKMGFADVLWAVKGGGATGERVDLRSGHATPLALRPSSSPRLDHGFASISNFFPGTKVLASQLMELIALRLIGAADVTRATVFDDQYISTGGQFYELIVGHDRFNADLRPAFYQMQNQPLGLCCHPYDCATWLIAEEAGVILTDATGAPIDGPLDTTTGIAWIGYANGQLRAAIEPLIREFLVGDVTSLGGA